MRVEQQGRVRPVTVQIGFALMWNQLRHVVLSCRGIAERALGIPRRVIVQGCLLVVRLAKTGNRSKEDRIRIGEHCKIARARSVAVKYDPNSHLLYIVIIEDGFGPPRDRIGFFLKAGRRREPVQTAVNGDIITRNVTQE